jgi:pseudaminic acid synthase
MIKNFLKKCSAPKLIAEISANHNGSIINAKKLILTAKKNGADAVKLQTYTASTMVIKSRKKIYKITKGLWKGKFLWDIYKKGETPFVWHKELFDYAKKINILCFSTPFDETAVDLLEDLNCPIYKIASFEVDHFPLIKRIAQTKKPIIISTGTAHLKDIDLAYKVAQQNGAKDIIILYCVSNYPAKISDFNLNNINILKKRYNCRIGFSDHSKDTSVATTAVAMGAEFIEKHIALENQKLGLDIAFSLKGKEIRLFKDSLNKIHSLLGKNFFYRNISEKNNKRFRRSIFSTQDIQKGEKFSKDNISCLRPSVGVSTLFYSKLIRKKSLKKIKSGTPIKMNMFKV